MMHDHPYVSEAHEGAPAFEWAVALIVIAAIAAAFLGHTTLAVCALSALSLLTGLLRLLLGSRSPWKVRSVAFDVVIGIGFAIGLPAVYFSMWLLR
ncbi:DUF3017 domain-containing protein [Bifidobacterium jacchi]|nr:DUF3017 domain-containing protein [Bifidobacterium jacchi]